MADKSVRVTLLANVSQYGQKLNEAAIKTKAFAQQANTGLQSTSDRLEKLGISAGAMKLGVAAAAVGAGQALMRFSRDAAAAQSALNEQMSATRVIFGDAAADVQRFAETAASSLFMSERAALQSANGYAQMLQNVGLSDKAIAEMSTTLTALSADLASQYDLPIEEAMRRLQSGLAGETEAVRRFGADLSEASIKSQALRLGLGGVGRELTHGEKLLTRYTVLVRSTATAHGDAARTANSLANQQRRLLAEQENLKAATGQATTSFRTGWTSGLNDLMRLGNTFGGKGGEELGVMERLQFGAGKAVTAGPLFWKAYYDGFKEAGKTAETAVGPTQRLAEAMARYDAALVDGNADSPEAVQALADIKRFAGQAASEQDKLAEATMTSAERFAAQREAMQDLHERFMAVPAAQRAMVTSGLDLADAQDAVAEKQRELQELMQRGPVDTEALAAARDRLASATQGVSDAEERLADARQRVADLQRKAPLMAEELALARARAQQEIAAAERRLSTVRAAGGSPTAIAEAETNLQDARLELSRIDERAIDQARDLEDARDGVKDAAKDVAQAQRDERKAAEEVARASQVDEDWSRRVEKAKRDLERAVMGVKDAEDDMVTTTWNLRNALDQQNTPLNTNVQLVSQLRQHYERMVALAPSIAPLLGLPNVTSPEKLMLEGARGNGGAIWPGTWLFGENGPELATIGAGGRGHVTAAPQTAQILRQSNVTSDASVHIDEVHIHDNTDRATRQLQRQRRLANLAPV